MEVRYVDHMGSDISVVNAARVSFGKKSEPVGWTYYDLGDEDYEPIPILDQKDYNLIRYLANHQHYSPFNHSFLTFHIKAPIFVARQLQKHEYMPWNEISRRYVDSEPEFYEPRAWRSKAENKKQGSGEEMYTEDGDPVEFFTKSDGLGLSDIGLTEDALALYRNMINGGVAPEMARMVLPQSMYTEWYWSGTLKAWAKMYNLRAKKDAQWETRQIALQAGNIIDSLFPVSWRFLTDDD